MTTPTERAGPRCPRGVNDPEIKRPITELGMVERVDGQRSGRPHPAHGLRLPDARDHHPRRDRRRQALPGVTDVASTSA
jgi:hypothetical protein